MDFNDIAERFGISGGFSVTRLRDGHINRTFLLNSGSGRFVVQALNRDIFPQPEVVMDNISLISRAFGEVGECPVRIPEYLCCDGRNFAEIGGEIWRVYRYIADSAPYSPYAHGFAVGTFLRVVNGADMVLGDPVPELHGEFRSLGLPVRNIHGDTKADNVIFGDIPAIIDLDTASRNTVLVDYGDMIRSITSHHIDLREVRLATAGFADGVGGMLSAEEVGALFQGVLMIVGELLERYAGGQRNFPNKSAEQCRMREVQLAEQLLALRRCEGEFADIIAECFR